MKPITHNENKPGYKETKIGWMPEAWECLHLKTVAHIQGGFAFKSKNFISSGPYQVVKMSNVYKGSLDLTRSTSFLGKISKAEETYLIKKSDILISLTGTVGKRDYGHSVYINSPHILLLNQRVGRIRVKDKAISSYLFYITKTNRFLEQFFLSSRGGTGNQSNVGISDIEYIYIPLPPFPEQKKIAEILSTWDRAIETMDKLIATKEHRKKGLMQKLLTGKVRFSGFSDDWRKVRLGEVGLFLKGKGILNSDKKRTGVPCITYGEIYTKHHYLIKELQSFIDRETAKTSQQVENGDILFAGSGETLEEIGKCVAYTSNEEAYAGGDIIIFRPNGVDSIYLSYSLNTDFIIRQKRKLGQGHSVVHIYSNGLKTLLLRLPTLAEQQRIVSILSACDKEIELLKKQKSAIEQQKKGLMQKLLTGAVRVTCDQRKDAKLLR